MSSIFLIFFLFDVSILEKVVFRALHTAMSFSAYAFNSIHVCFMYPDPIDLGKYEWIPGELNIFYDYIVTKYTKHRDS